MPLRHLSISSPAEHGRVLWRTTLIYIYIFFVGGGCTVLSDVLYSSFTGIEEIFVKEILTKIIRFLSMKMVGSVVKLSDSTFLGWPIPRHLLKLSKGISVLTFTVLLIDKSGLSSGPIILNFLEELSEPASKFNKAVK